MEQSAPEKLRPLDPVFVLSVLSDALLHRMTTGKNYKIRGRIIIPRA